METTTALRRLLVLGFLLPELEQELRCQEPHEELVKDPPASR
jgi:hypothetical protein